MDDLPTRQNMPTTILKNPAAIWMYLIAVAAVAGVVVLVPLLSAFGHTLPPEMWSGWQVCIGGLIVLIGAQGNGNKV